jgi:ornithine decarboxylase
MDCIAKDIYMPELEVGEWLYFKAMGAYTTAAASPFNGFKSHQTTFYINTPF